MGQKHRHYGNSIPRIHKNTRDLISPAN
jgi:hypothetical protein